MYRFIYLSIVEVTDRYLTKILSALSHLLLIAFLTSQSYQTMKSQLNKIKLTETTKLNKYRDP
jgi:hypothetical protein